MNTRTKLVIILIFLVHHCYSYDCQITAVRSNYDCHYYCLYKYPSRKYYNHTTKFCQKAPQCKPQQFYLLQYNICVEESEMKLKNIRDKFFFTDSEGSLLIERVMYGSYKFNILQCFPGYFSSKLTQQIQDSVFQIRFCDVKMKTPEFSQNYPQSFGEYFFNQMEASAKTTLLSQFYPTQSLYYMYVLTIFIMLTCIVFPLIQRASNKSKLNKLLKIK